MEVSLLNALVLLIFALLILNAILSVFIMRKDKLYAMERKDLLNRIMAKNLDEYARAEKGSLPKGNNKLRQKMEEAEYEGLYR